MEGKNKPAPGEEQAVLWPSEMDYPRFVEVSTDSPLASYAEFVARAQPMVDAMRAEGLQVIIVQPDPDRMAAWCRSNFGKVDTHARAAYAAVMALDETAHEGDAH